VLLEKWNVGHYFQCIQKYKVSVLVFFWLLLVLYLYIKDQHIPLLWSLRSEKNNQIYNSTVNIYSQINTMF